jgi:hypothetical protein
MDQISESLGQALLDHHKAHCLPLRLSANEVMEKNAWRDVTISYSGLCEKANLPASLAHGIGKYLLNVAIWCKERNLPPLHSLAVNAASRLPGFNYDNSPGTWGNWEEEVSSCIACQSYPSKI